MGVLTGRRELPVHVPAVVIPRAETVAAGVFDPHQRWSRLVGGGDGIVYAVQADGRLFWYRHRGWPTGAYDWSNGTGTEIGSGWHEFVTVLADVDGELYGVHGNGDVLRFKRVVTDPNTGEGHWESGTGTKVGSGFDRFPRVFGGPDGVIWGVDAGGLLYRSWNDAGTLTPPQQVGSGFNVPRYLMADTGGVIYAVDGTGALTWFRYLGDAGWANNGRPIEIGDHDWFELIRRELFAGCGNGAIYLIRIDHAQTPGDDETLVWLRLANHRTVDVDGGARWLDAGNGVVVGRGFTVERSAALQGYPQRPSVVAGERAGIALSTTFPSLDAQLVRVAPGEGTPTPVTDPRGVQGTFQRLPENYRSAGCGWAQSVAFDIGTESPSGVYAVRFTAPHGRTQHVPLVVRPGEPTERIAVVLPTNTYNAYNGWGGHDQYSEGQAGVRRTVTLLRPSYDQAIAPKGQYDVELYSDLVLLTWMTGQGLGYDCYTDTDLHGGGWLTDYQAVVLGTHPEYFSFTMRANLAGYLDAGGCVIATGANQIYERAEFTDDLGALVFRAADGSRDLYLDHYGLPASQLLGANYEPQGWMTFAPYRVHNDHPVLQGTGLTIGATFGAAGRNGPASGWEFDTLQGFDGEARAEEVIAQGENPTSHGGAVMLLRENPGGGFVFSASSLSFNGALPSDPAMSRLLRNVFDLALTR